MSSKQDERKPGPVESALHPSSDKFSRLPAPVRTFSFVFFGVVLLVGVGGLIVSSITQ